MKIKSTNPENIKSIIDPEDRAGAAVSEKVNARRNLQTSSGVASVKSGFELARSQTTLDKMIEGKVRESAIEVKNILIGLKTQVQQNQAETLKAQTQNVKTDGSVKFALKKLEVDECIMKAPRC